MRPSERSPPVDGDRDDALRNAAGDTAEALARLVACGADPGVVGLCRRYPVFNPADRPRDGMEVARAADERSSGRGPRNSNSRTLVALVVPLLPDTIREFGPYAFLELGPSEIVIRR